MDLFSRGYNCLSYFKVEKVKLTPQALQGFDEEDTDIRIQGYHSTNKKNTRFVVKDNDVSSIPVRDIIMCLHQPRLVAGRGVIYEFSESVDVKEV